jgi:hypothetical protein
MGAITGETKMGMAVDFSGCKASHRERFLAPLAISAPSTTGKLDADAHLSPLQFERETWRYMLARRRVGKSLCPSYYRYITSTPFGINLADLPAEAVVTTGETK